mmetsp:Transcript_112661/g.291039  ORF Transcript_112661/g.291039 Transcript_112661/m.291039 type:complete len:345 (+) Transcript_112661:65-1099(+)
MRTHGRHSQPPKDIIGSARAPLSRSSCMSRLPPNLRNFACTPAAIVALKASSVSPARRLSLRLQPSSPKRQLRSSPLEVKRKRLQPPQKASVMLAMTPTRPRQPSTLHKRATSFNESGGKRWAGANPRPTKCCCIASTISACGTRRLALHPLRSKGMNSRKRTSSGRCSVKSTKLPSSSSLTPRRSTQFNLTLNGLPSAVISWRTSITRVCHFISRFTRNGNFAGTNVSKLKFTFSSPASWSFGRKRANRTPLVVMPRDSGSARLFERLPKSSTMRPKSPRMVGSPPVRRIFRTPNCTKSLSNREISSVAKFSPRLVGIAGSSPSSGLQYWHLKLQRSVRDNLK